MRDLWKGRGIWALVIGAVAVLWSAPAMAERPSLDNVDLVSEQVTRLESTYLVPAVLETRYRLESRFNDAKVAYLLGDYERASILFVSVLDAPQIRQFDSYREALYLVGDSLFQMRSFRAGREYFRELVAEGPGPFYQSGIVRLLETAAEIRDFGEVDDLYAMLDDMEDVSPSIHYIRGKTLYDEGRFDAARPWFQRAARDETYVFRARYFEAVTLVAAGHLAEAADLFERLTRQAPVRQDDRRVRELSHIALGRLAYEDERYEEAVEHYLQVPRTSEYFDRALFELTWCLVARGSYRAALRNLDILLVSDPDPRFVPQAKALMADMAMRLREYEDARRWFGDIVHTFTPVRDELREFIEHEDDLRGFFLDLVREDMEGMGVDYVPPLVTEWIEDRALMEDSRQLVFDGQVTQADIDETYEAIEEIEAALALGSSIRAFPVLEEGWMLGIELEARLMDLQYELLDWELTQVQPLLGPADRERLAVLDARLEELWEKESATPRTRDELLERDREIEQRFRSLRSEVDRTAFEIAGLEELLDGIAVYMRQESVRLSESERVQVEEIRRELREEVRALEGERRELSRELERTQRAFGARDESLVRQRELRDEIQALQEQRAEVVDAQMANLQAQGASEALAVAEARRRLPGMKRRLDRYFDSIDEIVEERVVDIRGILDSEKVLLARYQTELDEWTGRTETTVASIALWNFLHVEGEFDRLVRRGHVGLVDVDWQRLEDARRDREDLIDLKLTEEEMIREAFPDVR